MVIVNAISSDLVRQWHPSKNGNLKSSQISAYSSKKIWWVCEHKHEWLTSVANRSYGTGCPYCSNKAVGLSNSLATINPKLAAQWHPSKNGDLNPTQVSVGSNKKVWWKCDNGHEWPAVVWYRSKGGGCPYCSGKAVDISNCLATVDPQLAKQWHPSKNGKLKATQVTYGMGQKVWWKCDDGHEWQDTINHRSRGRSCPYCSGQAVNAENCLATINPELAAQWHPSKNGDLKPTQFSIGSDKIIWWLCEAGHSWPNPIYRRSNGRACPYCSGKAVDVSNCLTTVNPELAAQWHPSKNGDLNPNQVTAGSGKRVWWLCGHLHEWYATISSRSTGCGCPHCHQENRTRTTQEFKYLASIIHNHRYDYSLVNYDSHQKVQIVCKIHGPFWQQVSLHLNGSGCKSCKKRVRPLSLEDQTRFDSIMFQTGRDISNLANKRLIQPHPNSQSGIPCQLETKIGR